MKKIIILMLFFTGILAFSAETQNKSVYTSTKEKDCKRPTGKFRNLYPYEKENTAVECPSYKNYRIFKVFQSGREWIDISDGTNIWTTRNEVISGGFGYWPRVREGVAEWRISRSGEVKAFIFRVDAMGEGLGEKSQSRLYVIGFDKGKPKLCGIVKTNEEAAKTADRGNCTKELSLKE